MEKKWIKFKDGMTEPILCEKCNKKTKHYMTKTVEAYHPLIMILLFLLIIGVIIAVLARCRLTCSNCKHSYFWWF